jgi:hypothetical protein
MNITQKIKLSIGELRQQLKNYSAIIADIQKEIDAKESILGNAYRDIKKGHPHYDMKLEMMTQLNIDRINLKQNKEKYNELADVLVNKIQ